MKRLFVLTSLLFRGLFADAYTVRPVSSVHARVIRDFVLRFEKVSSARLMPEKKGSTMYFIKDGFNNRAGYDANGRWLYSLVSYNEGKLPRDIRAVVKSAYYDDAITVVQEIQNINGRAWFVHLEDETTVKIVKVTAEKDMETVDEFRKQ